MNSQAIGQALVNRLKCLPLPVAWRLLVSTYLGTEYEGGLEIFLSQADCSGVVCGPLIILGYDIRTTADDLYRRLFTIPVTDQKVMEDPNRVLAVFYLTTQPETHFGNQVPEGYATHVAPVIGRYVVLHAHGKGTPNQPVGTAYLYDLYKSMNRISVWRELDICALNRHHRDRDMAFGIDQEMLNLR